uniref:Uncharacterized protein n=1 Tax=Arundo donax TaxID=35708 RepID=A0A0A9A9M2_ARUDO
MSQFSCFSWSVYLHEFVVIYGWISVLEFKY